MTSAADHPALNGHSDQLVAYIGYGSLVNRETLRTDYVHAQPVRLHGWRRCWRPRMQGDPIPSRTQTSLLSARQVPDSVIDGLLVFDKLSNLPAVDEREATYDRITVPIERMEVLGGPIPDCVVYVYKARTNTAQDDPEHPILQSYLDAVLQGYLREFGTQGVHDFIASTDGFERDIHIDRHDPIYTRPVTLEDHERHMFDSLLANRITRMD